MQPPTSPEITWKDCVFDEYSSLAGKRVLVRVDFNMPVKNGVISDTTRATATFPCIRKLLSHGAKVILLSHFGEKGESIEPIARYIEKELTEIMFVPSLDFAVLKEASHTLQEGSGMLLENVRIWPGEEECVSSLASSFASLGDMFINDAFSVSHRRHASVTGIPLLLPSYLGPTCASEITHLTQALTPTLPALLIVGGAKIATKLPLIQKYLALGVSVFVGGAMVHSLWKEEGVSIGDSYNDATYTPPHGLLQNNLLHTPRDVKLSTGENVDHTAIPPHGVVIDLGTESIKDIQNLVTTSHTIIMNGPLGLYEKGWLFGTEQVLHAIANGKAISFIGGGDTLTVAKSLQVLEKFTFVSLGGGAMLDFLSSGTLPGIDAVTKR